MANESHLSLLEKGVKAWNEWRLEHESDQADLSEASLTGADLGNADLSKADLSGAEIFEATLFSVALDGVNFERANVGKTILATSIFHLVANWIRSAITPHLRLESTRHSFEGAYP